MRLAQLLILAMAAGDQLNVVPLKLILCGQLLISGGFIIIDTSAVDKPDISLNEILSVSFKVVSLEYLCLFILLDSSITVAPPASFILSPYAIMIIVLIPLLNYYWHHKL